MHETDPFASRAREDGTAQDGDDAAASTPPRTATGKVAARGGGMLAAIRHHPRAWIVAGAAVAFVLLGSGAVALGAGTSARASVPVVIAPTTSTPVSTPTRTPTRPTPNPVAAASKLRTCSVSSLAADSRLGTLEAQVMNPATGEVLFDRNGSTPSATASVMKIVTGAAALNVLGPDYRIPTTVVAGSAPGQVVLVGGGDLTLSRLPTGNSPFYKDAAHMDALAAQVRQAWNADPANNGQPITSVVLDSSLFAGPSWQPSWDEQEERVVEGSTSYITALQVDGDRDDPYALESPRSTNPVGRAGQAFADDLGGNLSITDGVAPAGAKQLGQVLSAPVSEMLSQALTVSDNDVMEMLARLVAIKEGAGNTFSALNAGVIAGLQAYGIDTSGLSIVDGSGLSEDNRVPPSYLTRLMVKVLAGQNGLGIIYDSLPVSGKSGTLGPGYERFTGSSSVAVGAVNAKTGWINNGYTLAGVVHAADGTALTFAVFALGNVSDNAKAAIDSLVTGFYACGNNLSNT